MHREHSSTTIDHAFHLHQSELVQSVRPHIHSMFVFYYYCRESFVEGSRCSYVLNVLVILHDVHIRTDCIIQRQVHHLPNSHRARTPDCTHKSSINAQLAH